MTALLAPAAVQWRKIPYAPDCYEVSDSGIVRVLPRQVIANRKDGTTSIRHIDGHYLNQYVREGGKSKGHPVVSLSAVQGGKKVGETRVCLLVARAFHGCPYTPGDTKASQRWRIMHRDGDITNNYADNLEWIGNTAAGYIDGNSLYERNIRTLALMREEPVEEWIKRIWGEESAASA